MNSLEAIEKLRIRHEQEAQQCIEIDFISDKLEQGYSKEDLLKIMIPGIGIEKMEAICNLIKKESR